jgi:hypothetical protein
MVTWKNLACALMGLVCSSSLVTIAPQPALAESVGQGCAQPTKTKPLRFSGNQQLPQKAFKSKAFFIKRQSSPDSVLVSFEMLSFKKYQKKYQVGDTPCEVSLNRMVAIVVTDHPKGLETGMTSYSKARATRVYDAQTGDLIMLSTVGDRIGGASRMR